jgi:DNA-binding MarR family transcriptional regulator
MPEALRDETEAVKSGATRLAELENRVGFHLRIAQTLSFQAFAIEADELKLRPGLFAILTIIGANPGMTQTALSRTNGRDKSSLTPVLDDLVKRGLVLRQRDEANRRAYSLTLTPEGKVAQTRLLGAARRHEQRLIGILGQDDYDLLVQMLKRLSVGLGGALV